MEFTEVRIICNTRATPMVRVTFWLQLLLVALILRQSAAVSDQCSQLQEEISRLKRDTVTITEPKLKNELRTGNCDVCQDLLKAAKSGDVNSVKILFNCSNNTCTDDNNYRDTPLIVAAMYGHVEVVRVLLDWGAKVDTVDKWEDTPLHYAAVEGHLSVVKLLVERGADVMVKNKYSQTACDVARLSEHKDTADWLDSFACRYLLDAATSGDVNIVNILFKCSNDNCTDDDEDRNTPLIYAALYSHVNVVRVLLEGGANVDRANADRRTALHVAAFNAHLDVCRLLLDWGAEVDRLDIWKYTPLHYAAQQGHLSVEKLLVERGADVSVKNAVGLTASDLARNMGRRNVADWLDSVCRYLFEAAKSGDVNTIKKLFKFRNDNCTDNDTDRNTPLTYAAGYSHVEVVRVLLEGGAKVDRANAYRHTALHIVAYYGHLDVCRLLLDCGAKVDHPDKLQYTPLHYAAMNGHLSVVKLLVERGADVSVKNMYGETATNVARNKGRRNVADWLESIIRG